jgi:hypothetical protein
VNRGRIRELLKQLQKEVCNLMQTIIECDVYEECQNCSIHKTVNEILNELNNSD